MKDISLKDKITQGINDLFYIWKREFRTTFRDQGVLIFFVLVPLVYPLIYSFIYTNEVVREVPAVVVDDSRSSLSREYLRKVDATPDIQIVAYCADMEEAKQMLKDRLAYGIIYIPKDFSSDIAQCKQTQVSIYCDMSGLLYYAFGQYCRVIGYERRYQNSPLGQYDRPAGRNHCLPYRI